MPELLENFISSFLHAYSTEYDHSGSYIATSHRPRHKGEFVLVRTYHENHIRECQNWFSNFIEILLDRNVLLSDYRI